MLKKIAQLILLLFVCCLKLAKTGKLKEKKNTVKKFLDSLKNNVFCCC